MAWKKDSVSSNVESGLPTIRSISSLTACLGTINPEGVGQFQPVVQIVQIGERCSFESFDDRVTHEFMDSEGVQVYSFVEGAVLDRSALEGVTFRRFTRCLFQSL